ncbi:hypothetical protein [Leifsonia aquatica]|uniref:hypothetical protein n=1 Tax=Leifsonia aquatica TaxID=144185 RepID=UPI003810A1BF
MIRAVLFDFDGPEWLCQVNDTVGSVAAVAEGGRQPAVVDEGALELSDEFRGLGLRTAVLTNGTDTIRAEVAAMGIFAGVDVLRGQLRQARLDVALHGSESIRASGCRPGR